MTDGFKCDISEKKYGLTKTLQKKGQMKSKTERKLVGLFGQFMFLLSLL